MNEAIYNYAKLLVYSGINLKKGDSVYIIAETEEKDFVKIVVEECYKAGALYVYIDWSCQEITKLDYEYCSDEVICKLQPWDLEKVKFRADKLPAVLKILSASPNGLFGVSQEKITAASVAKYPIMKPYIDEMENKYKWCIAAVPGYKWAKLVFPDEEDPVRKLWESIFYTTRANGDAIKNWKEHDLDLQNRCAFLNSLHLKKLHYQSDNGTDLTVGLIEDALFLGGGEYTKSQEFFNPNIPSEEVFTTPMRGECEGIVYSTKPLSYQGQLIEDFSLTFSKGKVIKVSAKTNQELLEKMVKMDEGASYLGECALVPFDSPINNSGVIFYNTLFDENASCHLAIGHGFSNCLRDYEKYNHDEYTRKGINESMIHVDFMIGSKSLNIDGITKEGEIVPIFRNGNWA